MNDDLAPELLLSAYAQGVFPMDCDGEVCWFRPLRRAILPVGGFRASRSLKRSAKRYEITFDKGYTDVIRACADREETWISEEFVCAYTGLFERGFGHSCEAWVGEQLVGGVYGVALCGAFMAESMFHRATDAGKVALWRLVERLESSGYALIDVQYITPHLEALGAIEISRREYEERLAEALKLLPRW